MMRIFPLSLLLVVCFLSPVDAGECLNTLFLIVTFGLGGLVNRKCAEPKCADGVARLGLGDSDQENCGSCIADVESFPLIKGVAGCVSTRVFCVQDDLCGDAKASMTFGKNGVLDTDEDLYSYLFTSTPEVFELRVIAVPEDEEEFGSCTATIDSTSECQSCDICANGVTFTFDCSNQLVGDEASPGPVITDCMNFMFRKV